MFVTPAYAEDTTAPAGTTAAAPVAIGTPVVGETHSETGVAPEGESKVFGPFDTTTYASQLLWLVITFGFFYMLMQKVIVPRVGGILEDRKTRISKDLNEAASLKQEADLAVATYEKELAQARSKANTIASEAREAAKTKAAAERAAVEADLAGKVAAAESSIAEIKARAFADVGAIATETATAVIDRLIGGSVSQADVSMAVAAAKQEG
nr:F0F1 ATP synthase subunit B [uncultured Gellertiella sp.]